MLTNFTIERYTLSIVAPLGKIPEVAQSNRTTDSTTIAQSRSLMVAFVGGHQSSPCGFTGAV